jgi:polyhydroxyalkanoate synthesis regulator phasin
MSEDNRTARGKVSDGIKQGIGVLSAFKDALEETIQEARDRGDLSSDRAKEVMKSALHKAQEAAGEAKERLDLVTQREFDGLKEAVEVIREKVDRLESSIRGEDQPAGSEAAAAECDAGDGGEGDEGDVGT